MQKILMLSAATLVSLSSFTAEAAGTNIFSYVDLGYGVTSPENGSNGDYTSLSGSFQFNASNFVTLESTRFKNAGHYDIDVRGVGVGAFAPIGQYTNIFGSAKLIQTDYNNSSGDDSGYRLTAGLRSTITPRLELEGKMKYEDVYKKTSTKFAAALRFYVNPNFSLAANYDQTDINGTNFSSVFGAARITF